MDDQSSLDVKGARWSGSGRGCGGAGAGFRGTARPARPPAGRVAPGGAPAAQPPKRCCSAITFATYFCVSGSIPIRRTEPRPW
jgi:hypothetical protein